MISSLNSSAKRQKFQKHPTDFSWMDFPTTNYSCFSLLTTSLWIQPWILCSEKTYSSKKSKAEESVFHVQKLIISIKSIAMNTTSKLTGPKSRASAIAAVDYFQFEKTILRGFFVPGWKSTIWKLILCFRSCMTWGNCWHLSQSEVWKITHRCLVR